MNTSTQTKTRKAGLGLLLFAVLAVADVGTGLLTEDKNCKVLMGKHFGALSPNRPKFLFDSCLKHLSSF